MGSPRTGAQRVVERASTLSGPEGGRVSAAPSYPPPAKKSSPTVSLRWEISLAPTRPGTQPPGACAALLFTFLQVRCDRLEKGLKALLAVLPIQALAVCESNSIRKVIEPGLFLVIKDRAEWQSKESCAEALHFTNTIIEFQDMSWNFSPERVRIGENGWSMREQATVIVLAGDKSFRMGVDKSLLATNGRPMIAQIVWRLEGSFDEVLIGANDPAE